MTLLAGGFKCLALFTKTLQVGDFIYQNRLKTPLMGGGFTYKTPFTTSLMAGGLHILDPYNAISGWALICQTLTHQNPMIKLLLPTLKFLLHLNYMTYHHNLDNTVMSNC